MLDNSKLFSKAITLVFGITTITYVTKPIKLPFNFQ